MNYKRIYDALIEKAKNRKFDGYRERHHIIPRCMGGSDDNSNLVDLTPEEHYVAHQLLVKIHPNNFGLVRAASYMCTFSTPSVKELRTKNKLYGWIRVKLAEAQSESQSGEGNSQHGSIWITNGVENKKVRGEIPEGWHKGRVGKFVKGEPIECEFWITDGSENKKIFGEIPEGWVLGKTTVTGKSGNRNFSLESQEKRKKDSEEKEKSLRLLYNIYKEEGFEGVLKTGYTYSKPNLVSQFSKYLPEFVPQNGKKRKKS